MNKQYVQQYVQLEKEHWWFVVRQKLLVQFISKCTTSNDLSILNIGAAGGASSIALSKFGKVKSVETELYFLDYLQNKGIDVVSADIKLMPFGDNSFDMICAFDVIEHVEDDKEAFKEMMRICKPNGKIFIAVPALKMLWSKHDVVNGHCRRYSKQMLTTLGNHFENIEQKEATYFNTILFIPILLARKLSNLFQKNTENQQSDFSYFKNNSFVNYMLKSIFSLELTLLKFMKFSFGVSLVSVWQKLEKSKTQTL
jgi:SAM-dependent methyltransferase